VESSDKMTPRHYQLPRTLDVEPARALLLPKGESDRRNPVANWNRLNSKLTKLHRFPGGKLVKLDCKGDSVPADANGLTQGDGSPGGSIDVNLFRSPLEPHRSHQSNNPKIVIGVQVRDEDMVQRKPCSVTHHLPLGPLAAIE
jgi:hypothetical protein